MRSSQGWWQRGGKRGEQAFRLVEAPNQEEAADFEMPRVCGVYPIAMSFKRRPRRLQRFRRPAKLTRDERDLGFSDNAPRAGHGLIRTEGPRRSSQEDFCPRKIAETRHCDASERERSSVIAQCDPI
jgi:hypothetical protein